MDYLLVDADNHYYEAEDAFTRYASERMLEERYVRWLTESDGKRRRLFFGDRQASVIGNPTFNPVAQPGAFHDVFARLEAGTIEPGMHAANAGFGDLVELDPAYRDRDARLVRMDEQEVERAFLFPTLGVTVEGLLYNDADMLYDCFHAFNRWLEDDWGFVYQDRLYAAPYLTMLDLDRAIKELDWVLEHDARIVTIRPGPAYGRSPADPYFDPFWARINEAGVLVAYHALEGPSLYTESFRKLWAAPPHPWRPDHETLQRAVAGLDTAIMDTLMAHVLQNLFGRFPNIRVACVELGCSWVPYLMHRLDHAGGRALPGRPSDVLLEHVWVSPFPEENVPRLAAQIGVERVLFGSDWPHAEGTPEPKDYVKGLVDLDAASAKRILRDNALDLIAA